MGNKKPTWQERVDELAEFRWAHGRFPRSYLEGESNLYSFLQHQRVRYRAGVLLAGREAYLNEHIPGWLTPRKAHREEVLWGQRATEYELFLRSEKRPPSYKNARDPTERTLSVWMKRQRACIRAGTLSETRRNWLDTHLTGWQKQ
ncbi:hypothetical protein GCM10017708_05900 [Arthrobacter citreus]